MRTLTSIALSTFLVGCFGSPQATGNVTVAGTTTSVDDCKKAGSDDAIELSSGDVPILRVVPDDLLGATITVGGHGVPIQLSQSACDKWSYETHHNGYTIDHDPEVNGSLDAHCTLPNGGALEANVTFANCL